MRGLISYIYIVKLKNGFHNAYEYLKSEEELKQFTFQLHSYYWSFKYG